MNRSRAIFSVVFLVIVALFGQQMGAWAQAQTSPYSDDYADISLSNSYIEFILGTAGTYKISDKETYNVAGRYTVMTRTGDPETPDDDSKPLVREAPIPLGNWGHFKCKVGDAAPVLFGAGSGGSGDWSISNQPRLYSTPVAGYGLGIGGPYIEGEWITAGDTPVGLKLHISLVRDTVRIEMTLTNRGTTTQSIGLGFFTDTQVTDTDRKELSFFPGIGYSRGAELSDQVAPMLFSGSKIPSMLESFGSIENPTWVSRSILTQQDCTPPDYVAVAEWAEMCGPTVWLPGDYKPNELTPVADGSILVQWKQVALAPGASRKYVTYYGVGAASSLWTYKSGTKTLQDSVVAAVQGPRALKFDSVASASMAAPETKDDLTPKPFTISSYLYNTATDPGPYELTEASAYLYLPDGLTLVTGESAQQDIGDVPINSESNVVTWQVQATGEYSGELEYYVAFRAKNGWQQMVSRKILVPAAKSTVFRKAYQLVSVPFGFNNPSIDHIFSLDAGSYRALYYDAAGTKNYVPVTQVLPGQAFWMAIYDIASGAKKTYTLADDAAIVGEQYGTQSKEQYIELLSGWNMVGNPFVYPVYVGQVMVYDRSTNLTYKFDDAVKKGWLSKTIYGWNQDRYAYDSITTNDGMLMPWKGYWLRAKTPVTLVFRPAIFPGSGVSALPGGY